MTSDAKVLANRENALKSTGPNDSSLTRFNALKHGLTASRVVVTSYESPTEYEALVEALRQDFQPQTSIEELLVQQMASCQWRRQRLIKGEKSRIEEELAYAPINFKDEEYSRRSTYLSWINPLGLPDKEQQEQARSRLDYLTLTSGDRKKLHTEKALIPQLDPLLIRYDSALERQFYRGLVMLLKIQAARRGITKA